MIYSNLESESDENTPTDVKKVTARKKLIFADYVFVCKMKCSLPSFYSLLKILIHYKPAHSVEVVVKKKTKKTEQAERSSGALPLNLSTG